MRKIKYLDKVIIPSGSIIIDETGEDFFDYEKSITTSMDEMIRILAKKYLPYKKSSGRKYIKLNIYNLSAIRIAPSIPMTYQESKDILCKYAYCRTLYLSPNLTEVYCEIFVLYHDEDYHTSYYCRYDYGILYGNYPILENGSIVRSDYFPNEDLIIDSYDLTCIKNKKDQYTVGRDISMTYVVTFRSNDDVVYPSNDNEDGCVLVSTMRIIKEANEDGEG